MATDRHVRIVILDGHQPLDVAGPHEVFAGANAALKSAGKTPYRLSLVGPRVGLVRGESGLGIHADQSWLTLKPRACDTLMVAGGDGARAWPPDPKLISWLQASAPLARRVASVCTGSFLLAEAGLLDGRVATTHWARFGLFAERFPHIRIDTDAVFVVDGNVATSAGVTAGIDLALKLVEDDHGPALAQVVARHLVMFLRRPGGQSQFGKPLWSTNTELRPIREALDHIHTNPAHDLSVAALAQQVGMSERNFARVFTNEVGQSPGRYVEAARVEAAQRHLELEDVGVDTVADECGFGSAETMRRAFQRHVGIAPSQYRQRFGAQAPVTQAQSA